MCCLRCGYVSNSYDPFMDLSLELKPGCTDLRQCLHNFTAAETLDGKNSYRWARLLGLGCWVSCGRVCFERWCGGCCLLRLRLGCVSPRATAAASAAATVGQLATQCLSDSAAPLPVPVPVCVCVCRPCRCDGCRQLVPAKKQITIWDDPNVLVVHLKRFHDFSGQKISQVISYPLNLDLEEHMCPTRRLQQQQQPRQQALQFLQAPRVIQQQQQRPPTAAVFTNNGYKRANIGVSNFKLGEQVLRQQQVQQQQRALMHQQAQQHQQLAYLKQQHLQPQQLQQQHGDAAGPSNRGGPGHYELHGVLVHKGFTANSGHYYAYVRGGDPASHWYCANDSSVYRPQANEAFGQTRDAYMLFYVRRSMKQQADLPAQPEAPAAAAAAAQPAAAAGAAVAAAAQRLKRSSDVMIGPQLPPHLQQKRQRLQEQPPATDAMDTDEQHPAAAAAAAGGVFGPQLHPGYQQAAAAANTEVGPSVSKADPAAAAAGGQAAPAPAIGPLSPAAAAAGAAEARAAAKPATGQVASSSGSGAAANGSRAGLLYQAAATPQPLPAASGQQHPSPAVTSELAGYLPDYEDEEDVCVQPAAAAAQPLQQQQQQEPRSAAAAATGSGGSSGGDEAPPPAPGDVQAEREQIKSKLRAELSLRSDFKPALVDMLTVARDQGKSWRQVKPMLLMMLRQSAAVKETAEAVFAPFLRMAQTALSVCL